LDVFSASKGVLSSGWRLSLQTTTAMAIGWQSSFKMSPISAAAAEERKFSTQVQQNLYRCLPFELHSSDTGVDSKPVTSDDPPGMG
jgi:hypothetical protein